MSKKNYSPDKLELYTDIADFPIFNWFKCIDTKDYSYAMINRKECNAHQLNECMEAFSDLYCQYVDMFGISEHLQEIINLQNQILVHKIDMALTNDRSINMFIKIKEIELNDLLNVKQSKVNTSKIAIEKYLGFRLNEKEVTVKEYYEYLEAIKENV